MFLRIHHNGAVPRNWLFDRLARDQQEPNSFVSGLDGDLVPTIEQHQRVIPHVVDGRRVWIFYFFGQDRARIRGVSERARTREYISEGIACGLDFETLPLARRHRDIKIVGIGSYSFHRPPFTPEFAANHAHASAVIVGDLRDRTGRNILVAWVGHLQRRGQVRPQLEAVHAPFCVALWHLLVQNAAAGGHPLHVSGSHFAFVAQAVAMLDRSGQHVRDGLNSTVRMPWESCPVVFGIVIAKIVQQQEWIEFLRLAKAEGALQLYTRSFNGGLRLNNLFYGAE